MQKRRQRKRKKEPLQVETRRDPKTADDMLEVRLGPSAEVSIDEGVLRLWSVGKEVREGRAPYSGCLCKFYILDDNSVT